MAWRSALSAAMMTAPPEVAMTATPGAVGGGRLGEEGGALDEGFEVVDLDHVGAGEGGAVGGLGAGEGAGVR